MELKQAIEFLLEKFKFERYCYATLVVVSFLGMVVCIVYTIINKTIEWPTVSALFGPTGIIAYSSSRILKMWSDCVNLTIKAMEANAPDK